MNQFLKFILVGLFNTAFGYGTIFVCMYIGGISPELSNATGYLVGFFGSYFLNRYFTFKSSQNYTKEFVRFAIVFLAAYMANLVVVIFLFRCLEMHASITQVIAAVVYIVVSYLLNSCYVFRLQKSLRSVELKGVDGERLSLPQLKGAADMKA